METAILSPAIFAEVLMLRLVNDAARSSTMTWSTVGAENLEVAEARNPAGAASAFIIVPNSDERMNRSQFAFLSVACRR